MRRVVFVASAVAAMLAVIGGPAFAVQDPGVTVAKGNFTGILLALVFGLVFGAVFTVLAYRRVEFGEEPAHADLAHDSREGLGGHNVPEPGIEDMPTGGGA
ncbi:MAG: hypothetical protein KY462_13520 [Actinobacteria bacterium]|nr:hypothetical protein [Actinomycetota bacterium]